MIDLRRTNVAVGAIDGMLGASTFQIDALQYRSGVCDPKRLHPHPKNARTHSKKQIGKLGRAFNNGGPISPVVVDEGNVILAGHARVLAALQAGLARIPVVKVMGLTEGRKRAFILADNRIAQDAGWDRQKLAVEFPELRVILEDEGLEIVDTGFEVAEIDAILTDFDDQPGEEHVDLSALDRPIVCRMGDLMRLGDHWLYVGDAEDPASFDRITRGELAAAAFLDPPYNLDSSLIGGRGATRHGNFAMGSGEMSEPRFKSFLQNTTSNVAARCHPEALVYVCMDWRHVDIAIAAGQETIGAMVNMAVWVKTNAGQGSFYRSQHELIPIFRIGDEPHVNNVQLGRFGRSRSNVWTYPGANTFRHGRMEDLAAHPTVKNTDMIADAIKDCTRQGDLVLDCFGGSGSTLMACEKIGRRAALIEISPAYAQVTIERWQAMTGRDAIHVETGVTFGELQRQRSIPPATRIRTRR